MVGYDWAAVEPISVRIPEACRLTSLSRSRLYELMKGGEIEFVKSEARRSSLSPASRPSSAPANKSRFSKNSSMSGDEKGLTV